MRSLICLTSCFLFFSCRIDSSNSVDERVKKLGEIQNISVDTIFDTNYSQNQQNLRTGIDTTFINGLYGKSYGSKHSNSFSKLMYLIYFKNDKPIWLVHPAADFGRLCPVKGIRTTADTVFVQAPYENGKMGYKGLFVNQLAVGEHISFFPNGHIRYNINYSNNTIIVFDSLGKLIQEKTDYFSELKSKNIDDLTFKHLDKVKKINNYKTH